MEQPQAKGNVAQQNKYKLYSSICMHRTVALTGPTVDLHTTRGPATVHRWRRTLVRRAANQPTDSDRAYIQLHPPLSTLTTSSQPPPHPPTPCPPLPPAQFHPALDHQGLSSESCQESLPVGVKLLSRVASKVYRKRRQRILSIATATISQHISLRQHGRQTVKERAHSSLGLRWLLLRWLPWLPRTWLPRTWLPRTWLP